jgi:hypothetical protein
MTETKTDDQTNTNDPIPASLLPDITDAEIKTALCYVDAKTQCRENKELNFPDVFAESWAEMTADEAEDGESDDPDDITVAEMCQWFRQGLIYPNPATVPAEPARTTETVVPLGDLL